MGNILRIVSRKSALALWQAEFVKTQLQAHHPTLRITILGIHTEGDQKPHTPLYTLGGKGLFVKELEQALLNGTADLAVHSMKDVPVTLARGLSIAAILKREDPHDALLSRHPETTLRNLPAGALIGTSSLRRQAQVLAVRPDLSVHPLRGNVETRIQKLDNQEYDAIILAVAGLKRLQLEQRLSEYLSPDIMLPSIGQGALGIECRTEDEHAQALIAPLRDESTERCLLAERSMNALLDGGCQLPIAGLAVQKNEHTLTLVGLVASPDGAQILKARAEDRPEAAQALGRTVAEALLEQGARHILEQCAF